MSEKELSNKVCYKWVWLWGG